MGGSAGHRYNQTVIVQQSSETNGRDDKHFAHAIA